MMKVTLFIPFLFFLCLSSFTSSSSSSHTLSPSQSLALNQTLTSTGQKYELGFFYGGRTNKIYLGIWYFNLSVKTIVWVANRDSPARSSSASLKLGASGQILLSNQGGSGVVWSTNKSNATNPVLQLLDSGNLVVREADYSGNYIWQSFDYPTDTLLPGQKLGWYKNSVLDRYLTSWRSAIDPSSGNYSYRLDRAGDPEIYILKGGTLRMYRSGPWAGERFSGVPGMKPRTALNFTFEANANEAYYMFDLVDHSVKSRIMVDPAGNLNRFTWVPDRETWNLFWYAPKDQCDGYMTCGAYGVCNAANLFVCGCPQGFGPSNPSAWGVSEGWDGCVRSTHLECGSDGFVVLTEMKLPETGAAVVDDDMSLDECAEACRKDCNCTAYTSREVLGDSGCVTWQGDLRDMRTYSQGGQNLYIRLAAADLVVAGSKDKTPPLIVVAGSKHKTLLIIGVSMGVVALLAFLGGCLLIIQKSKQNAQNQSVEDSLKNYASLVPKRYAYKYIKKMTRSYREKLGEGGYGTVFKGNLKDGRTVAVKVWKQSKGDGQDFLNEVMSISRTSHVNVVPLLGFCFEGHKRALIYEFMPNGSLEKFIQKRYFSENSQPLTVQKLFDIGVGVARGLEYLHRGCNTRIVHFDIKPHNILLDAEFIPKISDFGLAKSCQQKQSLISMSRARGTIGYIAPELFFRMYGGVSHKSDVYSFGMMVLEMVGCKNKVNDNVENSSEMYFPQWIYKQLELGTSIIDCEGILNEEEKELERKMILVGLWCIQTNPVNRPSMNRVVEMLEGNIELLQVPPMPTLSSPPRQQNTDDDSAGFLSSTTYDSTSNC